MWGAKAMLFLDREDAGRQLASRLRDHAGRPDAIVLGLARGGVIVAEQVARALELPLDVLIVRKLGVPGHEELAMGAIASGNIEIIDQDLVDRLQIPGRLIAETARAEGQELERREREYRTSRPAIEAGGKTAILVDDGLATGASMRAAIAALRQRGAAKIVVAVPIAPPETCAELGREVEEIVCAETPSPFYGVGSWYRDFTQTTDAQVREALARTGARSPRPHHTSRRSNPGKDLAGSIRQVAIRLAGAPSDYDALLERMDDVRLVLIGEASHGTDEFYRERAELTRRLIAEKGFVAVAAEADWPDAYRINRYVRGQAHEHLAIDALGDFARFPAWMWRNTEVLEFVGWLREHNEAMPSERIRAGFYGLDLYSLSASMAAVIDYLDKADPAAARRARQRYACFDHFGEDSQAYGYATGFDLAPSCEDEVVAQLLEMRRHAPEYLHAAPLEGDEAFFAQQNALVVKNAEEYYRSMFRGRVSSWNLRDRHMMATLEALLGHLERQLSRPKVVIWAHNSHLGDARATEMGQAGELNLGQLVRERFGASAMLVGFSTFEGTVTAASEWGGPAERKRVRPALPNSYEALLHATGLSRFMLMLGDENEAVAGLRQRRLQRAIGVIYRPDTERISHYFESRLADQFDALIHIDQTRAVEPLEVTAGWRHGEVPETFPTAV
jgi:erythromycin esterase-like protein/predicted phosphoribosyltransferase